MPPVVVGRTDVGRRKANEDAFAYLEPHRFYVVADGMGGHKAGEVASQLAVETILSFISRSADGAELSWPYGIDAALSFEGNRVRTAIHLANRRVFRAAEEQDDYTGMGTTVVSALVTDSNVIVGHVGDSRLYARQRGTLQPLTKDDSWAMTILGNERRASDSGPNSMKNVLTNVVGAREQTEIHVSEHAISDVDLLLLCTDGLHGVLDDQAIAAIVDGTSDLNVASESLIRAALDAGSRDNITVVLVRP